MAFNEAPGNGRYIPPIQSDANDPAAQAFALSRLQQLVRAHLLGAVPQHMTDAAQVWRGLSATLQQNPQALQAFLGAGRQAPQLVSENGAGMHPPVQSHPPVVNQLPLPQAQSHPFIGDQLPQNQNQSHPFLGGQFQQLPRPLPEVHPALASIVALLSQGRATPFSGRQ